MVEEEEEEEEGTVNDGRADRIARMRALAQNAARNQSKELLRSPLPDVDMVPRSMLFFPAEYVKPLRMCGVSKKMMCLADDLEQLVAMACELVFVSIGEGISEHLQRVIWLFTALNRLPNIDGCAVEVEGRTRLARMSVGSGKKKEPIVVGIQELYGPKEDLTAEFVHYDDWPQADRPIQSFTESCRDAYMHDEETHVSTTPVRMRLGVVPIEYVSEGEKVRIVCMVLRVLPAEGFDVLKCIEDKYLSRRTLSDKAGGDEIRKWCEVWQTVLDVEEGTNLRFQGHRVQPDAMENRNPTGIGSACHILSPFLVFEKILNNLPGGFCGAERRSDAAIEPGSLLIGGYPRIAPDNDWVGWVYHMRNMDRAYLRELRAWRHIFIAKLAGDKDTQQLPRVLHRTGVFVSLDMEVSMRFSNDVAATFAAMQRVTLPKLAIACIGAFMSLVATDVEDTAEEEAGPAQLLDDEGRPTQEEEEMDDDGLGGVVRRPPHPPPPPAAADPMDSFLEYVRPYVEHDLQVATQFLMTNKYERQGGGSDMPHAGRLLSAQKSLQTALAILKDDPADGVGLCVSTFLKYLSTRIGIAEREEKNVYNSHRVSESSKILDSLVKRNLPGCVSDALMFASDRMAVDRRALEQRILPFDEMVAMYELQSAVMVFNESAKLNALNLSAYFALIVSDVLTFLGTHHATWIFKQFTVWTLGGNGHLRSKGMIYTVKRNSSGQGFVQDAFGYTLRAMATIPGSIFAEAAEALNYFKLTRITGPQIEALAAVVTVGGKVMSVPDPLSFLKFCTLDELLRNLIDNQALNTFITHIPRDADGSNNTIKTCDPANHSMIRQAAINSAVEGCGAFYGYMCTNSNPDGPVKAEALKSLSVVVHTGRCPVSFLFSFVLLPSLAWF